MNATHSKSGFTAVAALLLWATALPMAIAHETSRGADVVYPMVHFVRRTASNHPKVSPGPT